MILSTTDRILDGIQRREKLPSLIPAYLYIFTCSQNSLYLCSIFRFFPFPPRDFFPGNHSNAVSNAVDLKGDERARHVLRHASLRHWRTEKRRGGGRLGAVDTWRGVRGRWERAKSCTVGAEMPASSGEQ